MLLSQGFHPLITAQCVYAHPTTGVVTVGHIDDFLCHGPWDELASLLASLQSEYEVSGSMVGPQEDEVQ